MEASVLFRNFLLGPQWRPFIERGRKIGDRPSEDLAKFVTILIYVFIWLHTGNQI